MDINMRFYEDDGNTVTEGMEIKNNDGNVISQMMFKTLDSMYCGKYINTVTVGGIATAPEYRRAGFVRKMMTKMLEMAPERGWTVSLLHPFSFSYYRKFGYDKIADHKVLEFPIAKLDFVDRCTDLVRVNTEARALDCMNIYNEFSEKRNIMFNRYNTSRFPQSDSDGRKAYIYYDKNKKPASYIIYSQEQYFCVNRMASVALNIHEMAFTTPESLSALFGFIRMFEGEDNKVKIHNCAMSPEIDVFLKHYMHTTYTLVPDIAGRILDVKAVLEAHNYPEGKRGSFTVGVEDSFDFTNGVYRVEYDNGVAEAKKLSACSACDLSVPMPAFTQLMYGYDEYSADVVPYMAGARLYAPRSDFFNVFHKQNNGLFEHF